MAVQILTEDQRYKLDREPDRVFYSEPRFVQHLDEGFRTRLTSFYREHIPSGAVVLDLGSSWVSHLPEEVHYERVIGHGMNEAELASQSTARQPLRPRHEPGAHHPLKGCIR